MGRTSVDRVVWCGCVVGGEREGVLAPLTTFTFYSTVQLAWFFPRPRQG